MRRKDIGLKFLINDNTGVRLIKNIALLNYKFIILGAYVFAVIKKKRKLRTTIKKKLLFGIILQNRVKYYRLFGDYYIQYRNKACALLNNDKTEFLGTRVFSPLTIELFYKFSNPLANLLHYFKYVL